MIETSYHTFIPTLTGQTDEQTVRHWYNLLLPTLSTKMIITMSNFSYQLISETNYLRIKFSV